MAGLVSGCPTTMMEQLDITASVVRLKSFGEMKISEISSSYTRRVQLDQFEPIEYSETITAVLDEDDDPEEASEELQEIVRDNVERGVLKRVLSHKMESEDE